MEFSDDSQILEALKNGDESAFEQLFKRFYPRLRSYAIRFTKDDDLTRDLIQDCFVRLWEKRTLLASISLSSLLFTMVRNACLNHLKHRSIVEKHQLSYLTGIRGQERLYNADFDMDTEHATLYEELQEHIGIVMDRLPERSREVFTLSRFEGLKNREIAERLGLSVRSVDKHIELALKDLHNSICWFSPSFLRVFHFFAIPITQSGAFGCSYYSRTSGRGTRPANNKGKGS